MVAFDLLKLVYRSLVLKLKGNDSDQTADYDNAAATYDAYYSRYLSQSSQTLLDRLPLTPGIQVLDLACGTGFFSHSIAARIGVAGRLTAIDLSRGMLARNRDGAHEKGLTNIRFVEADACSFLGTVDDSSINGVVCGWGICYMDHARLLRELERIVLPGGFVGIIENRSRTLMAVSDLFNTVMMQYPDALIKNMAINLPRDQRYLVKTFCKKLFRSVDAWQGEVTVPCQSGEEIAEYMVKSGASAGFINALDNDMIDKVLETFIRLANKRLREGYDLPVKHEYCALLAEKP